MTEQETALRDLLAKGTDASCLREMIRFAAERLMELQVGGMTGAARGLALRHDHGSNVMVDHFQKQVRFWGISPSHAFVGETETNGVIERLFRTLKDQIVHGRVFQTIDEVRDFASRYNAEWLIEKNGFRSPLDARAAQVDTNLRRAA